MLLNASSLGLGAGEGEEACPSLLSPPPLPLLLLARLEDEALGPTLEFGKGVEEKEALGVGEAVGVGVMLLGSPLAAGALLLEVRPVVKGETLGEGVGVGLAEGSGGTPAQSTKSTGLAQARCVRCSVTT